MINSNDLLLDGDRLHAPNMEASNDRTRERGTVNSRERVRAALNHQAPDRVPLDFGATAVTGIHVSCIAALREFYGLERKPVKVHEPYQMLGWIDDDLADVMGIDVAGVIRYDSHIVEGDVRGYTVFSLDGKSLALQDAYRLFEKTLWGKE